LDPRYSEYEHWQQLGAALNATGRPIYYSICPKSVAPDSGTAVPYAGTLVYSPPANWTAADKQFVANSVLVEYVNNDDNWYSTDPNDCIDIGGPPCGLITNIDAMQQMTALSDSVPGSWNDCDMLQVCNMGHLNGGMTRAEYRAHFSVWSVMACPLILSADFTTADPQARDCFDVLHNADVWSVNQDPAGQAAALVLQTSRTGLNVTTDITAQIWVRPLTWSGPGAAYAAVLLNRDTSPQPLTLSWSAMGWGGDVTADVKDLWLHQDMGQFTGSYTTTVASHDVAFVVLTTSDARVSARL
jgi:hypothetical protein